MKKNEYVLSDQDYNEQDTYLTSSHPLADLFKIKHCWTTPIGEIKINLPEDMRISLIEYIASKGYCTTMGTHKRTQTSEFEENHYNLFDEKDTNEHIKKFEEYTSELIRYYIANGYNLGNVETFDIACRAFGNMQTAGRRTYPHYHHGFDGVMICYLTIGNEFALTTDLDGTDDSQLVVSPGSSICRLPVLKDIEEKNNDVKADYGSFELKVNDMPCEGDGTMLLQDPRPAINYPYNNKAQDYQPEIGKCVFHPAYVWHESNTYNTRGIRAAVVVNWRVLTNNNSGLVKPLSFPK
tara:strand:+ start:1328 stop:2212 length:885 start_codon:yes stop_codon:yes gene_type:complete